MRTETKSVLFSGLFIMGLFMFFTAQARAERSENPNNKKIYFTLGGDKLDARSAYKKTDSFLECKQVEVVYNEQNGKPSIKPVK